METKSLLHKSLLGHFVKYMFNKINGRISQKMV